MTKEEVIASLKHRIQQKDPVFRKQFLSISKEPDVKINQREFRKVGYRRCGASFLPGPCPPSHCRRTSFIVAASLFHAEKGVSAQ